MSLNFDGLKDEKPKKPVRVVPEKTSAPSRPVIEAKPEQGRGPDAQISIKGPEHIILRFKALCKADRRSYYDMLEILMNDFENS